MILLCMHKYEYLFKKPFSTDFQRSRDGSGLQFAYVFLHTTYFALSLSEFYALQANLSIMSVVLTKTTCILLLVKQYSTLTIDNF